MKTKKQLLLVTIVSLILVASTCVTAMACNSNRTFYVSGSSIARSYCSTCGGSVSAASATTANVSCTAYGMVHKHNFTMTTTGSTHPSAVAYVNGGQVASGSVAYAWSYGSGKCNSYGFNCSHYKSVGGTKTGVARKCSAYSMGISAVTYNAQTLQNFKSGTSTKNGTIAAWGVQATSSSSVSIPAHNHRAIAFNKNTIDTEGNTIATIDNVQNMPSNQTKCSPSTITLSSTEPTLDYYEFKGWNTAANGSGTAYAPGSSFADNSNVTTTVTLYAQWERQKAKVTLDWQGATPNGTGAGYDYVEAIPEGDENWIPDHISIPSRTGYTFDGFYENPDGEGTCYFDDTGYPLSTWPDYEPGTIYANWIPNKYTLTVYPSYGSNNPETYEMTYDSTDNNQIEIPIRLGYECSGVYNMTSLGEQIFNESGNYVSGNMYWSESGTWTRANNATVYMRWELAPIEGAVVFDANGGEGGPSSMSVTYGEKSTIPTEVPTRKRYTFAYWSTQPDGDGSTYYPNGKFPGDGQTDEDFGYYLDEEGTLHPVTLYAQWERSIDPEDARADLPVTYKFYASDYKNGLLDAEIEYKYTNFFGQSKTIKSRRAVIVDSMDSDEDLDSDAVAVGVATWKKGDPIPGLNSDKESDIPEGAHYDEDGNLVSDEIESDVTSVKTEDELRKIIDDALAEKDDPANEGKVYDIIINDDIYLTKGIIIPEGITVNIDLNDYIITGESMSENTFTVQGTLIIGGGTVAANGNKSAIVIDGGALEISNHMVIDMGKVAIDMTTNGGSALVNNLHIETDYAFKNASSDSSIESETGLEIRSADIAPSTSTGGIFLGEGLFVPDPTDYVDTSAYDIGELDNSEYAYETKYNEEKAGSTKCNVNCTVEGNGTVSGEGIYSEGTTVYLVATAEEHWLFDHFEDANGDLVETEDNLLQFEVMGDTTYKAVFKQITHNVEVISENGKVTGDGELGEGDMATIEVTSVDDGYKFVGWYDQDDNLLSSDAKYEFEVTEDVILEARYEELYVVNIKATNGTVTCLSGAISSKDISDGTTNYYFDFNKIARFQASPNEGYSFVKWIARDEETLLTTSDIYSFTTDGTEDNRTEIEAVFNEISEQLTYYGNGGTNVPAAEKMNFFNATKVTTLSPSREGYVFDSWNTMQDGSGKTYYAGDQVKAARTKPASVDLYAQWTEKTATLTYDANEGTSAPSSATMKYSASTAISSTVPTRSGYIFNKWNTKKDGTGTSYSAGDIYKAANIIPVAGTLYAQWTKETTTEEIYWAYDSATTTLTLDNKSISGTDSGSFTADTSFTSSSTPWYSYRYNIITVNIAGKIQPESTAYWFDNLRLTTVNNISNLDTSNVTNMSYMFFQCNSLKELDVSGFDTSNVTNMRNMFYQCLSLTELDLSGFDTSNVTDMHLMFCLCQSLTELDLSGFDTSNVTNMRNMFYNCPSLTKLDLSGFDTSNVTDMYEMFYQCSALKTIYANRDWYNPDIIDEYFEEYYDYYYEEYCEYYDDEESINEAIRETIIYEKFGEMFYGCTSLVGGNGTTYNSSHRDVTYAHIDTTSNPGYFTSCNTFTIDGTKYKFKDGMTWAEWVVSKYNTGGYISSSINIMEYMEVIEINDKYVSTGSTDSWQSKDFIKPSDLIVKNKTYYHINFSVC